MESVLYFEYFVYFAIFYKTFKIYCHQHSNEATASLTIVKKYFQKSCYKIINGFLKFLIFHKWTKKSAIQFQIQVFKYFCEFRYCTLKETLIKNDITVILFENFLQGNSTLKDRDRIETQINHLWNVLTKSSITVRGRGSVVTVMFLSRV